MTNSSRYDAAKKTILEEDESSQASVPFYVPEVQEPKFTATQAMEDKLDSENFTQRLDALILGFRNETMQEFIKTKGRLAHQKEQAIDAEKRRCATLLGAKQNEIENLKEQLS